MVELMVVVMEEWVMATANQDLVLHNMATVNQATVAHHSMELATVTVIKATLAKAMEDMEEVIAAQEVQTEEVGEDSKNI